MRICVARQSVKWLVSGSEEGEQVRKAGSLKELCKDPQASVDGTRGGPACIEAENIVRRCGRKVVDGQ